MTRIKIEFDEEGNRLPVLKKARIQNWQESDLELVFLESQAALVSGDKERLAGILMAGSEPLVDSLTADIEQYR